MLFRSESSRRGAPDVVTGNRVGLEYSKGFGSRTVVGKSKQTPTTTVNLDPFVSKV